MIEIFIILLGALVVSGGPGNKEKQLVCPIEIVQDGKLVLIEGDCDEIVKQSVAPPPCADCGPPPPCDNCGPGPDPEKVKSDNSDANGKGGNKHNRYDKTYHGTEVAENKKST